MMAQGTLPHVLAAPAALGANPTVSDFNQLIWWLVLLKVGIVFLFLLLTTMFMIWFERRVIGRMQNRPGPNRAGPFGLLQPIADALKLPLKEDIIPLGADKLIFIIAPVISAACAFVSFAIIPWGAEVSIFHHRTPLQLADFPVAVLLVLAMSSVGVYGIVLAGWASGSPYSLLGALRSAAQVISYEIAMGLAFVAVFLDAGSLSTTGIVNAQVHGWYAWVLAPSFLIYLFTMVGETNRLPFDLPEGEGELVAGYHTEYSSMKFAMFYLAEYINMIDGLRARRHAVPGRLAGALAAVPVGGREQRLVAGAVVPDQGLPAAVRLRLAPRHAAAGPLRPADGDRLEVPHPGLDRLDPAGRDRARLAARQPQQGPLRGPRHRHRADPGPDHDVGQRGSAAGRALRDHGRHRRRRGRAGDRDRHRLPGAADGPAALPRCRHRLPNPASSKEVTGA